MSRVDDSLYMSTLDQHFQHVSRETALKRKLIQDPDQPFWGGPRPKLGVTLGEAVVFSVLSLLLDAQKTVEGRARQFPGDESLKVRFSHPNWVSAENIRALACYRDAAAVAVAIFLEGIQCGKDGVTSKIAVKTLQRAVERHRDLIGRLPGFPSEYEHEQYLECSKGTINGVDWELIFESCAAGFPYLVEGERETFEDVLTKFPAKRRIRKILVVDVGAGSTDAGYMLRTIRPRDSKKVMKPLLIWLPAADALELAGRWLTDRLAADLRQRRPRVTWDEAEDHKVNARGWYQKPYVHEWTTRICDHIGGYVGAIRDEICLAADPALEIVLTGGSSVVKPLREATLQKVRCSLQERGLGQGLSGDTRLIEVSRPAWLGSSYREGELAQLAVALGASDPLLAELKSYPLGLTTRSAH